MAVCFTSRVMLITLLTRLIVMLGYVECSWIWWLHSHTHLSVEMFRAAVHLRYWLYSFSKNNANWWLLLKHLKFQRSILVLVWVWTTFSFCWVKFQVTLVLLPNLYLFSAQGGWVPSSFSFIFLPSSKANEQMSKCRQCPYSVATTNKLKQKNVLNFQFLLHFLKF